MSDPTRGASYNRHRSNADRRLGKPMTGEDSLMVEAYGPKGAALRKTAATLTESLDPNRTAPDSTMMQKGVARVKKLFGRGG